MSQLDESIHWGVPIKIIRTPSDLATVLERLEKLEAATVPR